MMCYQILSDPTNACLQGTDEYMLPDPNICITNPLLTQILFKISGFRVLKFEKLRSIKLTYTDCDFSPDFTH